MNLMIYSNIIRPVQYLRLKILLFAKKKSLLIYIYKMCIFFLKHEAPFNIKKKQSFIIKSKCFEKLSFVALETFFCVKQFETVLFKSI